MSLIACKNCGKNVSDLAETCPHCGEKIKGDIKMYSETIYNLFIKVLSNKGWRFLENKEEGIITVPKVRIDSSMKSVTTFISVRDDDCFFLGKYDNFNIASENMDKVCELLMRINGRYLYPQLILDYKEQNVYCQHLWRYSGDFLDEEVIESDFPSVGLHLKECGKAIMAVSLGLQSPEEALKLIDDND